MDVELQALDARNPVAFLAALGALRLATDGAASPATLHWEPRDGRWTALCGGDSIEDADSLIDALALGHEARNLDSEFGWERDIMKLSRDEVRDRLDERLRDGDEPSWPAAVVAACVSELPERPSGDAPYTPFRIMPRVGRARFLETARKLSETKNLTDELRMALFGPWRYTKANNLAWDPGATLPVRAYASEAPTHFGPLAVPGAMLLAVAALPVFPLIPTRSTVACRGFGESKGQRLAWPAWTRPMQMRSLRMLLGLPALYDRHPDERILTRHGIAVRFVAPRARFGDDSTILGWGTPDVLVQSPP